MIIIKRAEVEVVVATVMVLRGVKSRTRAVLMKWRDAPYMRNCQLLSPIRRLESMSPCKLLRAVGRGSELVVH